MKVTVFSKFFAGISSREELRSVILSRFGKCYDGAKILDEMILGLKRHTVQRNSMLGECELI